VIIRVISLVLCTATGIAAGLGQLYVAAALYVIAGVLEFFDTAES